MKASIPAPSTSKLLVGAISISLVMTLWILAPYLFDRYLVVKDMQNFYWMARYQNPSLFNPDYLQPGKDVVDVYFLGFHIPVYPTSVGYAFLFYLVSFIFDHIWFSKWLTLPLMLFCVIYLFYLGKWVVGNLAGFSLSLIFSFFILASYQSISIASGLQRSFAIPLLIIFLFFLIKKQHIGAALTIVVSALFFLPNFPLMTVTYALSLVTVERPFKVTFNFRWSNISPFIIACLISALIAAFALASQFGLLVETKSIANTGSIIPIYDNPYFQADGVVPLYYNTPLLGQIGILDAGTDLINLIVLVSLGVLIYRIVGISSLSVLPREIWLLVVASFIMYFLSLFVVLVFSSQALYWPSRYTRTTLFLVAVCFVGLNWPDFIHGLPYWLGKHIRMIMGIIVSLGVGLVASYLLPHTRLFVIPLLWFMGIVLSGVLALVLGSYLFIFVVKDGSAKLARRVITILILGVLTSFLGSTYIGNLGMKTIHSSDDVRNVYKFVATLPENALLAGNPEIMSGIPLFSQRRVLFRGLFPEPDAPILEFFDAQYSETPETLIHFCQYYGVDYLVLDIQEFSSNYLENENFFYQPYNKRIVQLVSGRSQFIVPHIQPIFSSGSIVVIQCDAEMVVGQ